MFGFPTRELLEKPGNKSLLSMEKSFSAGWLAGWLLLRTQVTRCCVCVAGSAGEIYDWICVLYSTPYP